MADSATAPVSVVIPCYRCAGSIERAVASVAAQSRRPAEIILVDDASADGTDAILEEIRARYGLDWIRIVTFDENQGPSSARNAGWNIATGKYVAFLDSDDSWHPRKLEIQVRFMEENPDVAACGHEHVVTEGTIRDLELPANQSVCELQFQDLLWRNQITTSSAMVRRDLHFRFATGQRYMEDHRLWLDISRAGKRVAYVEAPLAAHHKADLGAGGLSGNLPAMEKAELENYRALNRSGAIGTAMLVVLTAWSLAKFSRRLLMVAVGYSPRSESSHPRYLFPFAYLVLTQAMTALLVGAGLLGRSELAADIGVVQAATLATFFAFSGNARNLILSTRAAVPLAGILGARLVLLLPLCAAALLLSVAVARVDVALALALVGRRAVEWIGELELSDSELRGDDKVARRGLVLQSALLGAALLALAFAPVYAYWTILAWALAPAVPALRFAVPILHKARAALRIPLRTLLPHFGSTAATGVSLYAFRALLVLVAGRAVAGDLFAAFAVGNFIGTIFANGLGPSFSLEAQRSGRFHLPKILWLAILSYLAAGSALLVVSYVLPQVFEATHKSTFFWRALGWSLLGGVLTVAAQRIRLGLLVEGRGDLVFGPDVMIHILLIAAVPVLYATDLSSGWAMLYVLNAALAVIFYATSERGLAHRLGQKVDGLVAPVVVFFIFLPLFFLLSGQVYNPAQAWFDSGGVLKSLPLPVSLPACFIGLLLVGRYGLASPGLWTILWMLVLMLLSSAMVAGSAAAERSKMLMLIQILLPAFGLVLGGVIGARNRNGEFLGSAVFAVAAFVIPVQLIASWGDGSRSLGHSAILFGVYQHLQFVPVILVCGYLSVFPGLWMRWGAHGRLALGALLALAGVYAIAAQSVLAMFALVTGTVLIGAWLAVRGRRFAAMLLAIAVFGSFAGYFRVAMQTNEFHYKFSFIFPEDDPWVSVSEYSEGARRRLAGGWDLAGLPIDKYPGGGYLFRFALTERARQAVLVVKGELTDGEMIFMTERRSANVVVEKAVVDRPGPFSVEIPIDKDLGDDSVVLWQPPKIVRGSIRELRWVYPSVPAPAPALAVAVDRAGDPAMPPNAVRNAIERISDWSLFGRGILESPGTLAFGHPMPLSRKQRTSAHNFYIDFAYNFGMFALLPLLILIAYTAALIWRMRRAIWEDSSLFALAAAVAFLVLVECNLKVSLRQPYPGIAIFFLWGLLLARLREPAAKAN